MRILQPIYLDNNATTPVAPEVAEAMCVALRNNYGNPSSSYGPGREAATHIHAARCQIAELIGAAEQEIVFTGSATEANNMALRGVAGAVPDSRRHLIISAVEHPAIMEPARFLESCGWRLTLLPVDQYGQLSPDQVLGALRPDTAMVSIMLANNEIGTLQPIDEIARHLKSRGVLLHTDAAQAIGKIDVNVDALGVDLLTIAGHKFQASKGIGALYVRRGTAIKNVLYGAGQENGLRPGTENVPAIIGLGVAADLARRRLARADNHLLMLRDLLHERLIQSIPGLQLNGHPQKRLPNTLNISFPGVSGRELLAAASEIVIASVGSACHTDSDTPSGVFGALGHDEARAAGAVRLSVGWGMSKDEIIQAADGLSQAWEKLVGSVTT